MATDYYFHNSQSRGLGAHAGQTEPGGGGGGAPSAPTLAPGRAGRGVEGHGGGGPDGAGDRGPVGRVVLDFVVFIFVVVVVVVVVVDLLAQERSSVYHLASFVHCHAFLAPHRVSLFVHVLLGQLVENVAYAVFTVIVGLQTDLACL
ncbi:hypothetical protein GGTG_14281 [Gaeumannomyces tritici R3-111a-1]|uniref:Uncharacterized protein n=1 Tax=Gaeumannomyces tritici (strain R3-111a-1) TaxID=644352 RepID=J3PL37_GAET3|nr:hypothetical protein GGTG_14281 [Gaeumannomyces tritici R3-111a-1]EJT68139.1 hypothetical protein GGTG_14281 [Gaeumannomyces tritici R3-111a-1]